MTTGALSDSHVSSASLGDSEFKRDHDVEYAYIAGSMYKGISSEALVARMGRAGLLGYFGTGGLRSERIDRAIQSIQRQLGPSFPYGMNLLSNLDRPAQEDELVDLLLARGVRRIEAAAYIQLTPSIVRYRCKGLRRRLDGSIAAEHMILAKVSHPGVATAFLSPPPEPIVRALLDAGKINPEQAALARSIPMADDLCVEADSGGHTDQGVASVLIPTMTILRDRASQRYGYTKRIRVGAAGGIGTPHAAAAAFVLGADFILTGSINQCTVEAGTSDAAKDLLQQAGIQDTTLAPAGDMFEMGAKVQVLKRGLFFPARATKLYELYRRHESIDDIDAKTRALIQRKYFRRSFEVVWDETRRYYATYLPTELDKANRNPKYKMALIFKWYFVHATRLAMKGSKEQKVDYQIQCGPAMGAFNEYVKGSSLEPWRNRHVDEIARLIMTRAAELLAGRLDAIGRGPRLRATAS